MDFKYRAFLSYSHAADGKLAPALQRGLLQVGKPWYRRPLIKVFRDETSLAANPELWAEIERNLALSEFFILMASAQSAQSPWVRKEVQWWLAHRAIENMFIVVTDGELAWDAAAKDFDWEGTTCLPLDLRGRFQDEPLYVDLRWAKDSGALSLRHSRFRGAVLMLAAPLYGRPKDELDSDEIRQHRRLQVAAVGGIFLLATLGIASAYFFSSAQQEAARAEVNWRDAESRKLARLARDRLEGENRIDDTIKIALMAWRLARTDEAQATLAQLARASSEMARIIGSHTAGIAALAFSPDGSRIATMGREGSIQIRRVGTWAVDGPMLTSTLHDATGLGFSGNNARLLAWAKNGVMELWDLEARTQQVIDMRSHGKDGEWRTALNFDGSLMAVGGPEGLLAMWNANSGTLRRAPVELKGKYVAGIQFGEDGRLWVVLNEYEQLRLCVWDIATNELRMGPAGTKGVIADPVLKYQEVVSLSVAGRRLLTQGDGATMLWEFDPGLALRQVRLPQELWGAGPAILDATGHSLLMQAGGFPRAHWQVWALGVPPSLKAEGPIPTATKSVWSPDWRWRADIVSGGRAANDFKGSGVLMWDMRAAVAGSPAKTIESECDFRLDRDGCAKTLCEKLAPSLDEGQLRELFGVQNYAVMYDRYKSSTQGPLCAGQ